LLKCIAINLQEKNTFFLWFFSFNSKSAIIEIEKMAKVQF